jgi:hypothetical protein
MINEAALDAVVRRIADYSAQDNTQTRVEVLRQWLTNPDAVVRIKHLIVLKYRTETRPAPMARKSVAPLARLRGYRDRE